MPDRDISIMQDLCQWELVLFQPCCPTYTCHNHKEISQRQLYSVSLSAKIYHFTEPSRTVWLTHSSLCFISRPESSPILLYCLICSSFSFICWQIWSIFYTLPAVYLFLRLLQLRQLSQCTQSSSPIHSVLWGVYISALATRPFPIDKAKAWPVMVYRGCMQ